MSLKPATLNKKEFGSFLKQVMQTYDVIAPVELAEGVSAYRKIESPEEASLASHNTQKSAKEAFFPQSEVMFRYEKEGNRTQVTSTEEVNRPRLILASRPCDIQAFSMLDQVFSAKEYTDVYFLKKREKTTIVGFACNDPLSTCFCTSTGGGPFTREGSDIFLVDLGDTYLVEFLTEKGKALSQNEFLREASEGDVARAKKLEEEASKRMTVPVHLDGIETKLEQMLENPFWDRIHEKCLGCGACTFLCPTCHCFDISDEASQKGGQRVRNWDTCLFSLYSMETSGHNPRPSGRERTRQRLMHKFNYFPKNFQKIACVGCGRCILYCPVNFDIRQAIAEINEK
jgi:sulfhydrogenase subunit beta (sulfur reductase)